MNSTGLTCYDDPKFNCAWSLALRYLEHSIRTLRDPPPGISTIERQYLYRIGKKHKSLDVKREHVNRCSHIVQAQSSTIIHSFTTAYLM